MNVWLSLPFLDAADLRTLTVEAQAAGVAGLALSDHVCVPVDISSPYPYGKSASLPPETLLPDPLIATAALGMLAGDIRFMTGILIAPLRHPIELAKQVATVAGLLGGRFDLGLGVGWVREEFESLGLSTFDDRGAITDEMIPLVRKLWTGQPVAHNGEHFAFAATAVNPTPPGPVPVFIGGTSPSALRRAARFGDGWIGANHSVEELERTLAMLDAACDRVGRTRDQLDIRTGLRGGVTPERVRALRALGVNSLLLAPWQIGERRTSVQDLPIELIVEALPRTVGNILNA